MPLDQIFGEFAASMDAVLVDAMTGGVSAAIGYVRNPVRTAMGLYVIVYGARMVAGEGSARSFIFAVIRAACVIAILQADRYVPWVQEFFFTTLPNEIAAAMNGPRVDINSAQQFDKLWSASLNAAGLILNKATGLTNIINRGMVWIFAFMGLGGLLVMFAVFMMSRVTMAIVIVMGPFFIPLYLFGGTRSITHGWIGRLVGVLSWQIAASVVIRLLFVAIAGRVQSMQDNPGASIDEMLGAYAGISGVFWLGAIFMAVIPTAVAVGSSVGAAHTAAVVGAASLVGRSVAAASAVGRNLRLRLPRPSPSPTR